MQILELIWKSGIKTFTDQSTLKGTETEMDVVNKYLQQNWHD